MRSTLFDESEPRFAGRIAYRTVFPARLLGGFDIGDCTKWWGEDRHIVMYPVKPDRSEVYFVTSQPEPEFGLESWSEKGDVKVLRAAFEGFHPDVQKRAGRLSRRAQAGRWSTASRSIAGSTAGWCCWATPAIR